MGQLEFLEGILAFSQEASSLLTDWWESTLCTVLFMYSAIWGSCKCFTTRCTVVRWCQLTLAWSFCKALVLEAQQHVERRSLIMSQGRSAVLTYFSHRPTWRSAAAYHICSNGPCSECVYQVLLLYTGAPFEAMWVISQYHSTAAVSGNHADLCKHR